jgi:hypothetical protein
MAAKMPGFAEYQRNTTRQIPVVVLERLVYGGRADLVSARNVWTLIFIVGRHKTCPYAMDHLGIRRSHPNDPHRHIQCDQHPPS